MVSTGHAAQLVAVDRASAVEGDHMVYLRANANPFAHSVVVVAGHMGHDLFAGFQTQRVQKLRAAE